VNDRHTVLRTIRASLAAARLPRTAEPQAASRAPDAQHARALDDASPSLVASFTRELTAAGGNVQGPVAPSEAVEIALGLVRDSSSKRVLAWTEDEIGLSGLGAALQREGCVIAETDLPPAGDPRRERLRELGEAGIGLTGAHAGLADTGSLALSSGPGRPRLAWLLPPVHVAFLREEALHPDMSSFFARNPERLQASANLVFVTGPSRTADIELILTRGVHGPKQLHVILVR
jgi:L-lactate dehydrogenase complex protein LldG